MVQVARNCISVLDDIKRAGNDATAFAAEVASMATQLRELRPLLVELSLPRRLVTDGDHESALQAIDLALQKFLKGAERCSSAGPLGRTAERAPGVTLQYTALTRYTPQTQKLYSPRGHCTSEWLTLACAWARRSSHCSARSCRQ